MVRVIDALFGGSWLILPKGGEGGHAFLGKTEKSVYMND